MKQGFAQTVFTCSKPKMQTSEQCVQTIETPESIFLTLNIFHTFFSVFVVDFKQVNAS